MNVSRRVIFLLVALVFSVTLVSAALADAPEPAAKKKQTVLKKYISAAEAYRKVEGQSERGSHFGRPHPARI